MFRLRFMKTLAVSLGLLGMLGLGSLQLASVAYADDSTEASKQAACEGIGGDYVDGECQQSGSADLDTIIANIVNILSVIVGLLAVIMVMVAGFKYITANGDSSQLSSAKSTLTYAIIGLVIVALAQFIVKFVIENVS